MVGMIVTLIVYTAYILIISFTLWMAIDAAKQDRFWWVVIVVGVPIVGGSVYYLTEKKHEYAKAESHHIHESQTEREHEVTPSDHHHHRKGDVATPVILAEETHSKKEEPKEGNV